MASHKLLEKFGIYFADVGLSKTYGRMFGFFMTATQPVSMGQLVDALQISKSTASIELRRLLAMGVIEKVLQPEQRADFYQLKQNLWNVHLHQKMHDIQKLRAIIEAIPTDELAHLAHLSEMAEYCTFMEAELAELIGKYAALTSQKKQITPPLAGAYSARDKQHRHWLIEWCKLDALSETFADKMASLADLGIDSFKCVETEFLRAHPQATTEDPHLAAFANLNQDELANAMHARLHGIFHMRPADLSQAAQAFMGNVYYYVVTIKDSTSGGILGFITFMGGGPVPQGEYKITMLAVAPHVRRAGLASHLVDALNKIGVPHTRLCASTRPSNTAALKAYRKWGFTEDRDVAKDTPAHFVKGHWVHFSKTAH